MLYPDRMTPSSLKRLIACALLLPLVAAAQQRPGTPVYDPTPRIGILIPKGPPDYALLLDALHDPKLVQDGPFDYRTGTLAGIPVVLTIQPTDGEVMRALGGVTMIHDFNLRAVLYPGTSGGHLPKGQMAIGDIVLGAQNVDYGNYHLSATGVMDPGEFVSMQPGMLHYGPLYADPQLLAMLACSAHHVASATTVPAWLAPVTQDKHPQIFYYGIQGSSTVWSDNKAYTEATMKVFHEIDEDGDWYSNLAATIYKVPFIEVSIISNSIFAFPDQSHGTPNSPTGEPNSHVFAQRLSNRIALDLIARYGSQILAGTYSQPTENPYPAGNFLTPTNPRSLLAGCQ
jgi:adenosylhomocysteine nucleosidase